MRKVIIILITFLPNPFLCECNQRCKEQNYSSRVYALIKNQTIIKIAWLYPRNQPNNLFAFRLSPSTGLGHAEVEALTYFLKKFVFSVIEFDFLSQPKLQ